MYQTILFLCLWVAFKPLIFISTVAWGAECVLEYVCEQVRQIDRDSNNAPCNGNNQHITVVVHSALSFSLLCDCYI